MNEPSVTERAWGFSEEEYLAAFSLVLPRVDARQEVALMFERLRANSTFSVGGDDGLFGLLSLVSSDARLRIQAIRNWDSDEVLRHQQLALERTWVSEEGGEE